MHIANQDEFQPDNKQTKTPKKNVMTMKHKKNK